jgi:TolA-binding protein
MCPLIDNNENNNGNANGNGNNFADILQFVGQWFVATGDVITFIGQAIALEQDRQDKIQEEKDKKQQENQQQQMQQQIEQMQQQIKILQKQIKKGSN